MLGKSTSACLQNGFVLGTASLLDGLADRFCAELGAQTAFFATGDLPRSIREACRTPIHYRESLITDGLHRIWLRNRNILVSAAAGSGKTAVLVERILQKITDREHPVDIDRLLIVTFTRAAAAEMRERIGLEIQKRLLADPDNENLQRQETLLFHAQITTIDSFCQSVLRTYFHLIDLDPAFSIVDEGEAKLLRRDTAEELLEEKYREGDTDFLQFVECFANGKNDENLIEMIWQVYEFSRSHPWPEEWLEECKKNYEIDTLEDLISSEWMKMICEQVDQTLNDLEMIRTEALKVANSPYGPWMHADALEQDGEI